MGLLDGDIIEVFGSATGTEPNAASGTMIGTVDVFGAFKANPAVMYWTPWPYYGLVQVSGSTPGGKVGITGTP
jgi:hypothetical protein